MIFIMFKLGLHKRVFILTLRNEIQKYPWTIPWGATSLNLSFAPQQKKYKPEWQMPERSRVERERSKVERSGATTFCPFFLHVFSLKYEPHTTTPTHRLYIFVAIWLCKIPNCVIWWIFGFWENLIKAF